MAGRRYTTICIIQKNMGGYEGPCSRNRGISVVIVSGLLEEDVIKIIISSILCQGIRIEGS